MAQTSHVKVVTNVFHQFEYQLGLVERGHVCPRLFPDLSRQLAHVGGRGEEGGRAVDGCDEGLGEAALFKLVRRHLAHGGGAARPRLGAGYQPEMWKQKFLVCKGILSISIFYHL